MKPRPALARLFAFVAFLLLACALPPAETRADPVVISNVVMTSGSGTSSTNGILMTFGNADATIQLTMGIGRGAARREPNDDCQFAPGRCAPGTFMSLTWSTPGFEVGGGMPGLIGGRTGNMLYGGAGGAFSNLNINAGSILIPTGGADSYTFVVPFTVSAVNLGVFVGSPGACCRPPDFIIDFTAQGLATIIITRGADGSYRPTSGTFQVNPPVPEPATLLLLGTGLAGATAAARRRRRRKQQD